MSTCNEFYSNNPKAIDVSGVTGSASVLQFPTGSVKLLYFKARADNIGSFFIGESPVDCHYEMDAGNSLSLEITDLNELYYHNPSGTSDFLAYMRQY